MNKQFKRYINLLKDHHWHWKLTTDYKYVQENEKREKEILKLQSIVDKRFELFNTYSPVKK